MSLEHLEKLELQESRYCGVLQESAAAHKDVVAAKAEEGHLINDAMKEAEESYQEMMEIHSILDQAYTDLMEWRS